VNFAANRPFADPEKAAQKLLEIANAVEAVQDGRIHIEKINGPFLERRPQLTTAQASISPSRGCFGGMNPTPCEVHHTRRGNGRASLRDGA